MLVSTPMFSGPKTRMKPLIKILGHSYVTDLEKSKMGADENHFMTTLQCHRRPL